MSIGCMSLTAWGLILDIAGVFLLALTLKFCFYLFPKKMIPKASWGEDNLLRLFIHYFSWFLYWSSWLLIILGFVLQLVDQF